jgi:cell division septation protein DedD
MWNWNTKYTLGSIILGILLLAIFGINRAASWLTQSNRADNANGQIAISANETNDRDGLFGNRQEDDVVISQPNGTQNIDLESDRVQNDTLGSAPLERAGTYIQRQKRVETDPVVASSQVNIEPVTATGPQAAPNSVETDQPTVIPTPTPTPQPTARPAAPAVPALW